MFGNYLGELSALLTAFLWSGTSYAFADAAKRIGSVQTNVSRMMLAAVFLFLIISVFGFSTKLSYAQVQYLIVSGIAGLVFGDSFLFKSFQLIGARPGMLIMSLVPAFSSLLAFIFLGEDLGLITIIGIVVTLTGVLIVVLEKDDKQQSLLKISKIGIAFGILGALGQASGLILAKFAFSESNINGFVATFVRVISAVVIILPLVLLFRKFKNPVRVFKGNSKAFTSTLTGTILGPTLGITFSLIAIANTKIGIASTLMSTMPVIMLPMGRIIFKERISFQSAAGAVIAVIGVAILFLV